MCRTKLQLPWEQVFSETIARKSSWLTRQDLLPLMPIMMPTYTAPTRAIPTVKATWGIWTVGKKDSSSVFDNFGSLSNLPGTNLFPALWPFLDCSSFGARPLQARRTGLPGRKRTVIKSRLCLGKMPPQLWESQWWWSTPSSTWLHLYHH